jgi:hypothetical protein
MTYKEFKRQIFAIYSETYSGEDVSPIEYGIRRAEFEDMKLRRLIELAEQTAFSTARRKVAGWKRQLERVQLIRMRLEERRREIPAGRQAIDGAEHVAEKIPVASLRNTRASQPIPLQ